MRKNSNYVGLLWYSPIYLNLNVLGGIPCSQPDLYRWYLEVVILTHLLMNQSIRLFTISNTFSRNIRVFVSVCEMTKVQRSFKLNVFEKRHYLTVSCIHVT